jgi:RNA polymerase sigma factor (sigma-70 family)
LARLLCIKIETKGSREGSRFFEGTKQFLVAQILNRALIGPHPSRYSRVLWIPKRADISAAHSRSANYLSKPTRTPRPLREDTTMLARTLLSVSSLPYDCRRRCAVVRTPKQTGGLRRDRELEHLLRAANAGDAPAYRRFLENLALVVRAMLHPHVSGAVGAELEDIAQDTLLAVHLKRQTWDEARPIGPWVRAIARNKLIDQLRRRGRAVNVPIEEVIDRLPVDPIKETLSAREVDRLLEQLSEERRLIVRAISIEGLSVREVAQRLGESEGTVRVALHRALAALAARSRDTRLPTRQATLGPSHIGC